MSGSMLLRQRCRADLISDVVEAEAEVRRGGLRAYEDVSVLMSHLEAESDQLTGEQSG
jgi:hypothetical protein